MSTRSLGSLTLDLIAKVGGFTQGMDQAARVAASKLKSIEDSAYKAGNALGTAMRIGAGMVAAQASAAAAAIGLAINRMDELSKAAARAQLPIEDFTELEYAGRLSDVAMSDLVTTFGRLAKSQQEALKDTSSQAAAFKQMGVEIKNADGSLRRGKDIFYDLADAYRRFKGSPEALAAGQQIFGRSFQNLIPLMKDGSQGLRDIAAEANELGLVFDQEAGSNAEAFNDNLTRMKELLSGLAIIAASEVLPKLLEITNAMVDWVKESKNAQRIADAFSVSFDLLSIAVNGASVAWELMKLNIGSSVQAMLAAKDALIGLHEASLNMATLGLANGSVMGGLSRAKGVVTDTADLIKSNMDDAYKSVRQSMDGIMRTLNGGGTVDVGKRKSRGAPLPFESPDSVEAGGRAKQRVDKLQQSYDRLMASMSERIGLFGKEGEAARLAYQLEHGELNKLTDAQKEALMVQANKIDQLDREKKAQDELNEARKREVEDMFSWKSNIEDMLSDLEFEYELLKMTNEQREVAVALRYANAEAASEEGRLITDAIRRNQQFAEDQMKIIDGMDAVRSAGADFFLDFASGAQSFKDSMLDALESVRNRLLQMAAEKLFDQLLGAQGTAQTGSAGGFWANMLGAMFKGGRAGGGSVSPGSMYRVNETGMEMVSVGGRDYLMTGGQSGIVSAAGGDMSVRVQPKVEINIENQTGAAMDTSNQSVNWDGEKWVIGIVAKAVGSGKLDRTFGSAFGVRRQGYSGG
jgi:hypothetical protein